VTKPLSRRDAQDGGRTFHTVLHKGRVEVDKWVAANVSVRLPGIMMTQGNDSDFLTMTSRDQCAMINRAFGLDSRRFVRLPSRNQNSMNYLLNQVPDAESESESHDFERELTERLKRGE
jgi:hypothetical protein